MVGVKYISYLTPAMSDNIILACLCFDWHSGIMFVSWIQAWNTRLTCKTYEKLKFEFHQCWIGKKK